MDGDDVIPDVRNSIEQNQFDNGIRRSALLAPDVVVMIWDGPKSPVATRYGIEKCRTTVNGAQLDPGDMPLNEAAGYKRENRLRPIAIRPGSKEPAQSGS